MSILVAVRSLQINKLRSLGASKGSRVGSPKGSRGVFSVEFAFVLLLAMMLYALVGEILRLSMIDQALARATHLAARAVATAQTNSGCHALASDAINNDYAAPWLLDSNDDGTIAFHVATTATSSTPIAGTEVQLTISWDQDPADGIDFSDTVGNGCGDTGSWLRVRSRITVQPWFGLFRTWIAPEGIVMRHESWGRNNRL